jgi:mycoredoxin
VITIYGRPGCAISQMLRRRLDRRGIPYRNVDIDRNQDVRARLAWLTGGRVRSPTVTVDGEVLVQPTADELEWALRRSRAARTA